MTCNYTRLLWLLQLISLITFTISADFYALLGISKKATHKEIKKGYRQQSLQHHPDKGGNAEKFSEIARAYEVLSDETLRGVYDRRGEEGLKEHESRSGGGGGGGGFDPFEDFFNMGGRRQRDDGVRRTDSVEIPLKLSMKQFYLGETLDVEYVREVLCKRWEDCVRQDNECSGPGIKTARQQIAPGFVQQVQMNEPRCISRGKSWRNNCKACPHKTETEKIELTIDVSKGMRPGERVTFEGVTDEKPGFSAGDLHFVLSEIPHKEFKRDGDHLYLNRDIELVDALVSTFNLLYYIIHCDRKIGLHCAAYCTLIPHAFEPFMTSYTLSFFLKSSCRLVFPWNWHTWMATNLLLTLTV